MDQNGFSKKELRDYAASQRGRFESVLQELVNIPTVSVEPDRKGEVHRGAEFSVSLLKEMGATAKLYETKGHPLVYGRFDRVAGLRPARQPVPPAQPGPPLRHPDPPHSGRLSRSFQGEWSRRALKTGGFGAGRAPTRPSVRQ